MSNSIFLIQELYSVMQRKNWGRTLTIGSVQQLRPHHQMVVYAASKVAQASLVKSLTPKFASSNVTINNLASGVIAARNKEALADHDYIALTKSKIPLDYVDKEIDCASLSLLLCSDAGKYITGQDMFVDG